MIDYKASHYHTLLHFPFTAKCQCPKKNNLGKWANDGSIVANSKGRGAWRMEGGRRGRGGRVLSLPPFYDFQIELLLAA